MRIEARTTETPLCIPRGPMHDRSDCRLVLLVEAGKLSVLDQRARGIYKVWRAFGKLVCISNVFVMFVVA